MDANKYLRSILEIKESLNIKKQLGIISSVLREKSLYSNMPRKSFAKRLYENLKWYLLHWEPCRYYNSYGFDIVNFKNQKEYIPYRRFRIERNNENYKTPSFRPYENQTVILRDKILFAAFLGQLLGPKYLIDSLGYIDSNGQVYDLHSHTYITLADLIEAYPKDVFIKKLSGECGEGCYVLNKQVETNSFLNTIRGSKYIIQPRIEQHAALNRLNPSCINTVRITTVFGKRTQQAYILAHSLRVGINKINDNQATGGLAVPILSNGELGKLGIGHHHISDKHPITQIPFSGYKIPYWQEVKDLVLHAHSFLPQITSIGWDIAITPNGPVLLEGNDNWEISLHQEAENGLKSKWQELHNL